MHDLHFSRLHIKGIVSIIEVIIVEGKVVSIVVNIVVGIVVNFIVGIVDNIVVGIVVNIVVGIVVINVVGTSVSGSIGSTTESIFVVLDISINCNCPFSLLISETAK